MKKINNAMPLLELETQKLSKAYLESPYLEFLEGKLGKLLTKMYQYELKKSDESVVALKQEESELVMKYQAATAALSFEFRGEKYNMPQMGKFLQDTDRETRKEAAEVYYSGLNAHKDELEDIFDKLVKASYKLLNLSTFLTCGTDECRAWTFRNGMTAPQCAGIIHSDFEKGFIKAEIYKFEDFKTYEFLGR